MLEDIYLILLVYLLYWITFLVGARTKKSNFFFLKINLILHLVYSVVFIYNYFNGSGGSSLAVLIVWLVVVLIHWLINLSYFIFLRVKRHSQNPTDN